MTDSGEKIYCWFTNIIRVTQFIGSELAVIRRYEYQMNT